MMLLDVERKSRSFGCSRPLTRRSGANAVTWRQMLGEDFYDIIVGSNTYAEDRPKYRVCLISWGSKDYVCVEKCRDKYTVL